MTLRILRNKITRITSDNRFLLLVNLFILCFVCGTTRAPAMNLGLGLFDYALVVFVDHYYVLYCMLPILLIVITRYLRGISEVEQIRYQSNKAVIKTELISFVSWFGLYILFSLIVVLSVGLTAFEPKLTAANYEIDPYHETLLLLNAYRSLSNFPIVSIFTAMLFYCFGFAVLVSLLALIKARKGIKNMISISILVLVLTFIGFHTQLNQLIPPLFFNNYLILHHGLFLNGHVSFFLILVVGTAIILYALGYRPPVIETGSLLDELTITKKSKLISFLLPVGLMAIEFFQLVYEKNPNLRDLAIRLLLGSSRNFPSFIGWLKLSLIYLLPLFFIGISISKITRYQELPIFIRYRSFGNLRWEILKRYGRYLLFYGAVISIILLIFFLTGNDSSILSVQLIENLGIALTPTIFLLYLFCFLGRMLSSLVLFLVISEIANETAAFVIILILSFVAFIAPNLVILNIHPGILSFLENLSEGRMRFLVVKASISAMIPALYFGFAARRKYAANQPH